MSRELRLNLIFLIVLAVLAAPGFYILMRKRFTGTNDRAIDRPHPTPHAIAYVQPDPVPPNLPRVEPPAVREWVTTLAVERGAPRLYRGAGDVPVLGGDHLSQLIDLRDVDGRTRASVLCWRKPPAAPAPKAMAVTVTADGAAPTENMTLAPVAVPRPVRQALQRLGYIDPPDTVAVLTFDVAAPISALRSIEVGTDAAPTSVIRLKPD